MDIRTTQEQLLNNIKTNTGKHFAPHGSKYIGDTADHSDGYSAIFALEDASLDISSMTGLNIDNAVDFTIPKGSTIHGVFPTVSLNSGKVLAYKL